MEQRSLDDTESARELSRLYRHYSNKGAKPKMPEWWYVLMGIDSPQEYGTIPIT